jgi:PAS domain S-box-containing protein
MVNVPGAIYRSAWHANFTLELISDEIERISGYPAANFIASKKRTLWSILHPEDKPKIQEALNEARDDGEPFGLEYRIIRADGEERWVLDRGQLVRGSGGRLWCDGALFDVTERRAAEEAARHREIERARSEELHASRARIVEAADAARRKIERDLHDGAQQRLVALALEVRLARARVDKDPGSAGPFLERVGQELTEASSELRELARGIHPAVLTERGLAPAISALISRAPLPVDLVGLPEDRLPPATEATAYFTVAEALTNVAKYAEASHATVRMERENGIFAVEISDDGKGGAQAAPGSGLSGLADRVGAADGVLTVTSPPGDGTIVRAELPLTR